MRSNKHKVEFFKKMKKKPALQSVLDYFDEYSIDNIKELKQPKWIKDILVEFKKKNTDINNLLSPNEIAMIMTKNSKQIIHTYKMYRYIGTKDYISNIEIYNNELCLVIDDKDLFVGPKKLRFDLYQHMFKFVDTVESKGRFNIIKNDELWNIHCKGEDRIQTVLDQNKNEKNYGMFTIKKID